MLTNFKIRRGTSTSWIQPKQSERTVLVGDNQIVRWSQYHRWIPHTTNTTDETCDIVDDEIPVQQENEEQPSATPEKQSEPVSDQPKIS